MVGGKTAGCSAQAVSLEADRQLANASIVLHDFPAKRSRGLIDLNAPPLSCGCGFTMAGLPPGRSLHQCVERPRGCEAL